MSAAASTGSPNERRASASKSFTQDENQKHHNELLAQLTQVGSLSHYFVIETLNLFFFNILATFLLGCCPGNQHMSNKTLGD